MRDCSLERREIFLLVILFLVIDFHFVDFNDGVEGIVDFVGGSIIDNHGFVFDDSFGDVGIDAVEHALEEAGVEEDLMERWFSSFL